ncbi:hypothetical protein [Mahella australiensis]|uniref:Uncharacterized protein n=1 Tax=Mahella australiensis (strain DSM 15567 / CIP 107919 / 50-1 BON) TaxID=697281 RepID=F3ZWW4_MAHA5|nr:hypothetical protein [Mahella australiensis]AEE97586.1 hypothetical protein Mahau_2424 [Mahella australiensis 50-1 BON]
MLKKSLSVLLALVIILTLTAVPAFASRDNDDDNTKHAKPDEEVELEHKKDQKPNPAKTDKDEQSTPGKTEKGSSGGGGSGSGGSSSGGSGSGGGNKGDPAAGSGNYIVDDWIFTGETETTTETKTYTDRKVLYYEWTKTAGLGAMTMVTPNTNNRTAGPRTTVKFSAVGNYTVKSVQWVQDVEVTEKHTYTRNMYKHITANGTDLVWLPQTEDPPVVTRGKPTVHPLTTQTYTIYVTDPSEDIDFPPKKPPLVTTANVEFTRDYLYTEKNLDAKTWKPFEVELTFTLTTNSKITKLEKPYHLITRYQNNGTMTVSPVEFRILSGGVGSSGVTFWAKFKYTKAGIPGKSLIYFSVTVKTNEGPLTLDLFKDAPVNTLNGRFVELPDNQHGEVYPIKTVPYRNAWGTITWQRTVN